MARGHYDFGDGSLIGLWRLGDELPIQPDHLDGLRLWLKADAITGVDPGDPVGTWIDSSPVGNDATQTGSLRPVYMTASGINGLPVVRFDGIDDYMDTGSDSGLDTDKQTWFVVSEEQGTHNSGGADVGVIVSSNYSSRNAVPNIYVSSDTYLYTQARDNTGTGKSVQHTGHSQVAPEIIGLRWNTDDTVDGSLNGLEGTAATGANDTPTGHSHTRLGAQDYSVQYYWNGDIAEVIIFDRDLDDCEYRSVMVYLAQKYALDPLSLPGAGTSSPQEVKDRSGSGNHGTRDNTALAHGYFQNSDATDFTVAGSDGVGLGAILDSSMGGADKKFSIGLFVETGDVTTTGEIWVLKYYPTTTQSQFLVQGRTNGRVEFFWYDNANTTYRGIECVSPTITNDTKYHIVFTYDGSIDSAPEDRCEFYINSVKGTSKNIRLSAGTFPFDMATSTAHLGIGAAYDTSGNWQTTYGNSKITEVAIYDRIITESEVAVIYNAISDPINHSITAYEIITDITNYYPLGCYGGTDIVGGLDGTENATTKSPEWLQYTTTFNGTSSYLDLDDIFDDIVTGTNAQFTIGAWVKAAAGLDGANGHILSKVADSACSENQRQFFTLWRANKFEFLWYGALDGSSYHGKYTTASFDTGKWYLVTWSYDGTEAYADRISITVNGASEAVEVSFATGTPSEIQNGTAHVGIGKALNSSGGVCGSTSYWEGEIGPVFIADTLLDVATISGYYFGELGVEDILSHQFQGVITWCTIFPEGPTLSGMYPKPNGLYNTSSGLSNQFIPSGFSYDTDIQLVTPLDTTNSFRTTSAFGSYRHPLVGRKGS